MNHYFSFKQFTIQQQFCAMKVCTDACIFGAYVALHISQTNPLQILDIGAGTGLLSLMLAQKNKGHITAVEIDNDAFEQCKQNFEATPWKQQLLAIHTDVQLIEKQYQFDCIISNPPFFEDDILSVDDKKNAAKHATTLNLQQLLCTTEKLLTEDGIFYALIPYSRLTYFIKNAAMYNLFTSKILNIKQTPTHQYFRAIIVLQKQNVPSQTGTLIIKEMDGTYSKESIILLKDYYLFM